MSKVQRRRASKRRRKAAATTLHFCDRLALSVAELAAVSSISRGSIYNAVKRGDLRLRKVGDRSVIMMDDADRWLRGDPAGATDNTQGDGLGADGKV